MNAFRVARAARAALRARPAAMRLPIQPLQRRGYADAAPDKARIPHHRRVARLTLCRSSSTCLSRTRYDGLQTCGLGRNTSRTLRPSVTRFREHDLVAGQPC